MALHRFSRRHSRRTPAACLVALLGLGLLAAGCNVLGVAAQALPEPDVPARYADLRGHSVAVLVWLPRGLQVDYPSLRLDLTSAVQGKLQRVQSTGRGELKSATFPHAPASLVRFQEDHPELERTPIVNVAPRLGVQRLIYVELSNLQTRSEQAVELFRGSATVSLRVVEVEGGKAKIAYEESGLTVTYPPMAREEGVPGVGDARIYRGTIDLLSTVIAKRFYAHPRD
jgi:hypothetical protein